MHSGGHSATARSCTLLAILPLKTHSLLWLFYQYTRIHSAGHSTTTDPFTLLAILPLETHVEDTRPPPWAAPSPPSHGLNVFLPLLSLKLWQFTRLSGLSLIPPPPLRHLACKYTPNIDSPVTSSFFSVHTDTRPCPHCPDSCPGILSS